MTLSTSLFNKGMYKNIISRFKWGSFLYFVILFFSVPFALLVQNADVLTERYIGGNYMGLILTRGDYAVIPMLLATVVPTVVAALVYGSIHSQKQGIFIHGLPAKRGEIYVSTLAAAFTLMGVPVILNGIILLLMSLSAYGQLIYTWTVFFWMAHYLAVIFIMFSVSTLAAYLSGNAAAHIAINVFIHVVPLVLALAIYLISEVFLFGFVESDNFIANEIMNNTPIVWLFGKMYRTDIFKNIQIWIYIVGAAVVYALTYVLYKNRKIEACGDVAAFKKFRPILKYAAVVAAAVVIFGILASANISALPKFIVAIVVTCIVYFAAEMLMNKTFKVFGTYKGYLAFLLCGGIFISFFAYTSVFGYETRVPDLADTVKASAYVNAHPRIPYVSLPDEIDVVREIHSEIVSDISGREKDPESYHHLYIRYELKNGKSLVRRYKVTREECTDALSKMYDIKNYKVQVTNIDNLNIENINDLDMTTSLSNFSYRIAVNSEAPKILYAIEKDLDELSYREIEVQSNALPIRVGVSLSAKENRRLKFFKKMGDSTEAYEYYHESFGLTINSNFKHTVAVLKELGYYDTIMDRIADSVYICKNSGEYTDKMFSYKDDTGAAEEFMVSPADLIKLEKADGLKFAEDLFAVRGEDDVKELTKIKDGRSYFVYVAEVEEKQNVWLNSYAASYKVNELPVYLQKYVTN